MLTLTAVLLALIPWAIIGPLTIEKEPDRGPALDALPCGVVPVVPVPVTICWGRPGRGK